MTMPNWQDIHRNRDTRTWSRKRKKEREREKGKRKVNIVFGALFDPLTESKKEHYDALGPNKQETLCSSLL